MGDLILNSFNQFTSLIPIFIVGYFVFDFLGSFFFGKR